MQKILFITLLLILNLNASDSLPIEHISNKAMSINGYYIKYGQDKYDWIYIDRETEYVSKLVGPKEDGSLEWNTFPKELFEEVNIDASQGLVTMIPKSNAGNPTLDFDYYGGNGDNIYYGVDMILGGFNLESDGGIWELTETNHGPYYDGYTFDFINMLQEPNGIRFYGVSEDGLSIRLGVNTIYGHDDEHTINLLSYLGNKCFKVKHFYTESPPGAPEEHNNTFCKVSELP